MSVPSPVDEAVTWLESLGVTDRITASTWLPRFHRYARLSIDDRSEVLERIQPLWMADPGHGNSGPGFRPFPQAAGPFPAGE